MTRKIMKNGSIKLSSNKGIIDTRNGAEYSVVVCKEETEIYFIEKTE